MIGIIGESGSGKSTFINIITGLITHNEGGTIDGIKHQLYNSSWHKIGLIPQEIFLFDDTVKKYSVHIKWHKIDEQRLEKAIKFANLYEFISNLEQGHNTIVGERGFRISGGQKQRIGMQRVFYNDPI